MSTFKTIVCLANSEKHDGKCIAGKEIVQNTISNWMRPISARNGHEISDSERTCDDGARVKLLDIVKVPVISASPLDHQTENFVIDGGKIWERKGEATWHDLGSALDHPDSLWTNGDSTWHGHNDRVHRGIAKELKCSLYLIEPESLVIRVIVETSLFKPASRKVRAVFTYRKEFYNFYLTDEETVQLFRARPNGDYPLTDAYISVSLSEPHTRGDGNCYKLVAAIITAKPL
ncbi:dual OB domain-containing protein [Tundrisphaera lichenicola]|uniref:dual OB domain-containing protein n=1 Tax=Tundrisphaera lichenicola TaxID=2029860 RepID=UPI003EB9BCC5